MRSSKPLLVKDHQNNLPIKKIEFSRENDLVLSLDARVVKMWNNESGKPYAAIEPGTDLNDLALYPNTGM